VQLIPKAPSSLLTSQVVFGDILAQVFWEKDAGGKTRKETYMHL
jgi:hypothetical protein